MALEGKGSLESGCGSCHEIGAPNYDGSIGNCTKCHGSDPKSRKGNLRFDTREGMFAEVDKGRYAVVPGSLERSELWKRITTTDHDDLTIRDPSGPGNRLDTADVGRERRHRDPAPGGGDQLNQAPCDLGLRRRSSVADCIGGVPNPRWVEWLLSFPSEWLSLKPLETRSFLCKQQQHLRCLLQG